MLYRGQDLDGHNKNNGVISPKGDVPAVVPLADGTWKFDGKFTFGETEDAYSGERDHAFRRIVIMDSE
ncbi:hypothetical protein NLY09_16990 (plasmid) [Burkholderia vietnamiensis]